MTRRFITLLFAAVLTLTVGAQNASKAKSILDKTAKIVSNKGGASANFKITGSNTRALSGKISIKGNKFQATTPDGSVWYNGKTQWAYMTDTEEVNVSTPTDAQQAQMNPYKFITLYQKGYDLSMKTLTGAYEIHLKAKDAKQSIKEMYITVNSKTYLPSLVKMQQGGKWSTISISNFKAQNLSDALFTFNPKQYPDAEVIDLR